MKNIQELFGAGFAFVSSGFIRGLGNFASVKAVQGLPHIAAACLHAAVCYSELPDNCR